MIFALRGGGRDPSVTRHALRVALCGGTFFKIFSAGLGRLQRRRRHPPMTLHRAAVTVFAKLVRAASSPTLQHVSFDHAANRLRRNTQPVRRFADLHGGDFAIGHPPSLPPKSATRCTVRLCSLPTLRRNTPTATAPSPK